jgi:hypothetical protein
MTAARADLTALPPALRRLADALEAVLAPAGLTDSPPAGPPRLRVVPTPDPGQSRRCRWCHHPMPDAMRIDAEYCSTPCRKQAWRQRTARS